jgi:hypothetical protein
LCNYYFFHAGNPILCLSATLALPPFIQFKQSTNMAAPRTKRQFTGASVDPYQRQITSFFSTSPDGLSIGPSIISPEPFRQPVLPASIQSNLLSVGMRIRKSVPEGYKTTSPSAFKLWTDNTPLPVAPKPNQHTMRETSRELMPFCGINSIGGLSSQPEAASLVDVEEDDTPALDAVPELTMSQESVESIDRTESSASPEPSRKRIFEENYVEDTSKVWVERKPWDGAGGPRSITSAGWRTARAMAIPRSRTKKTVTFMDRVDQENMMIDSDFQEAEFLVYGEREMDTASD